MMVNDTVKTLKPNQIFVFGSNLAGRHGKGAALYARQHFGAVYGIGTGPTGRCYAIPTKDEHLRVLPWEEIELELNLFLDYAREHQELEFLLTPVGTGLAGYDYRTLLAWMLKSSIPRNVKPTFRIVSKEEI